MKCLSIYMLVAGHWKCPIWGINNRESIAVCIGCSYYELFPLRLNQGIPGMYKRSWPPLKSPRIGCVALVGKMPNMPPALNSDLSKMMICVLWTSDKNHGTTREAPDSGKRSLCELIQIVRWIWWKICINFEHQVFSSRFKTAIFRSSCSCALDWGQPAPST